jgi:hypothetical protein
MLTRVCARVGLCVQLSAALAPLCASLPYLRSGPHRASARKLISLSLFGLLSHLPCFACVRRCTRALLRRCIDRSCYSVAVSLRAVGCSAQALSRVVLSVGPLSGECACMLLLMDARCERVFTFPCSISCACACSRVRAVLLLSPLPPAALTVPLRGARPASGAWKVHTLLESSTCSATSQGGC